MVGGYDNYRAHLEVARREVGSWPKDLQAMLGPRPKPIKRNKTMASMPKILTATADCPASLCRGVGTFSVEVQLRISHTQDMPAVNIEVCGWRGECTACGAKFSSEDEGG